MYRARVEAVSGVRVRAGGKWLTCIGNKNIRVGDLIWTDGRCVYGHEQTPQQPHVITSGEDLAIPIARNKNFYTYQKKLKYHDAQSEKTLGLLTNTRNGHVYISGNYISGKKRIIAANADEQGNLFYIAVENDKIEIVKNGAVVKTIEDPAKQKAIEGCKKYIAESGITPQFGIHGWSKFYQCSFETQPLEEKDEKGNVIASFPEMKWMELRYSRLGYLITVDYENIVDGVTAENKITPSNFGRTYRWAFIEDENNWGIILTGSYREANIYSCGEYDFVSVENVLSGHGVVGHMPRFCHWEGNFTYTFLINNEGEKILFEDSNYYSEVTDGTEGAEEWDYIIANWLYMQGYTNFHISPPIQPQYFEGHSPRTDENLLNLKLPMQDGFYFVINSVSEVAEDEVFPKLMDITIYTANNKEIFKGTFYTVAYIAACAIGNKFLLAVTKCKDSTDSVIGQGLYEIENGKSKRIEDENLTVPLDNPINQCLRPMKRYKGWYEKIESID